MGVLNVPESVASQTHPTETQLDTMRTYLLNFFNGGQLDQDNIATGGVTYASLGNCPDDSPVKWENSEASLMYESATNKFVINSEEGSLYFGLRSVADHMTLLGSNGSLILKNTLNVNTGSGSQLVDLQWLLARYRKPRLSYITSGTTSFSVIANMTDSTTAAVMMRDKLYTLVSTTCNLSTVANGYTSTHTGAASNGRADNAIDGTLTANRWYYVYAVKVRYGTDADGTKAILVARLTPPLNTNVAALNDSMGTDCWVYMGCVRAGDNDGVNDTYIVPFSYDASGFCTFTHCPTTGDSGAGLSLVYEDDISSNTQYVLNYDNDNDTSLPATATRLKFTGWRSSNGFELQFVESATDEIHAIASACHHIDSLTSLRGVLHLEVPALEGYEILLIKGDTVTDSRVCLAGFQDHML